MKYLVFQHINVEHPGILRDFWADDGITWDAIELDEGDQIPGDFEQYDALVVMGGPMDVWQTDAHPWLVEEINAIKRWITETGRPFLGVCLGHQLLAEAMGGSVGSAKVPEVGFSSVKLTPDGREDPLLSGVPGEPECFQWHGAEVTQLPEDSVILASSPDCEVQSFRYGTNAYGFQYHIEITDQTVPEWGVIPEYEASLEQVMGEGAMGRLKDEVLEKLPAFNAAAKTLHQNFLAIVKDSKSPA